MITNPIDAEALVETVWPISHRVRASKLGGDSGTCAALQVESISNSAKTYDRTLHVGRLRRLLAELESATHDVVPTIPE